MHDVAPKIVLAMIMKNEEKVLPQTLRAVLPLIDAYAIVDTGSTDRSKDVAREILAGLPGEIIDVPWKGFSDARNQSLDLASRMGDWMFILDADDVLEMSIPKADVLAQLKSEVHPVPIHHGTMVFTRPLFVRATCSARFSGVVHEFLDLRGIATFGQVISGTRIIYNGAGTSNRNLDPKTKYLKDAELLSNAIAETDDQGLIARYTFYLAQSYRDAGRVEDAFRTYETRTKLPQGYDQEIYVSYLQMGFLAGRMGHEPATRLHHYLMAYQVDPNRAEAQFNIAELCRSQSWWHIGWKFILDGIDKRIDVRKLFVDGTVHRWRLDYEMSIAAYYVGMPRDGRNACLRLLALDDLAPNIREVTKQNLTYYPAVV